MEIPLLPTVALAFDTCCTIWLGITLLRVRESRKVMYDRRVRLLQTLADIRDSPVLSPAQRADAERMIQKITRGA